MAQEIEQKFNAGDFIFLDKPGDFIFLDKPAEYDDRIGQLVKMARVIIGLLLLTLGVGIIGIAMRF